MFFCSLGLLELRNIERNSRIQFECREALKLIINKICCDTNDINLKKRKRGRKKRISAPKRMANPFRLVIITIFIIVIIIINVL